MTTQISTLVTARVSNRLLNEVPRFFGGGLEGMLAEIFQNCYRAGASYVRIELNEVEQTLVIADDGCGIDDPQILLTAGDIGWDEHIVVEPAGLGAFALLDARVVESVTYESRDWCIHITPEALQGKPCEVLHQDRFNTGTQLRLTLKDKLNYEHAKTMVKQARALYPFTVTFACVGSTESAEIIPPAELHGAVEIALARLGRVFWSWTGHRDLREIQAVWAHVPRPSLAFADALAEAADRHPLRKLAHALIWRVRIAWVIDPASGVRPRLPDRRELQAGPELDQAARCIVNGLVQHVMDWAAEASKTWPRKIEDVAWYDRRIEFKHFEGLDEEIFVALGWRKVRYTDYNNDVLVINESDGHSFELDSRMFYDRDARLIGSECLCVTLNHLGYSFVYESGAWMPHVSLVGLRVDRPKSEDEPGCAVALADQIVIEGIGSVPFILPSTGEYDFPGGEKFGYTAFVFGGSVRDLAQRLFEDDILVNAAFWWMDTTSCYCDAYDYLRDDEIDLRRLRRDLLTEAAEAFDVERARQQAAYYAGRDVLTQLREMANCVSRIERALDAGGLPVETEQLAFWREQFQSTANAVATTVNALAAELELDPVSPDI